MLQDSPFQPKYALPNDCPPKDAVKPDGLKVLRLVESQTPKAEDFYSHEMLGIPARGKVCPCKMASCSTFLGPDDEHTAKAYGYLPKIKKKKYIAELILQNNAGLIKIGGSNNKHIDVWFCAGFDPLQAVNDVWERPE